ncbi:MAG: YraN family protein [Eudoraea sp.]|nr:YraN family protein [Eudoraea sp.]
MASHNDFGKKGEELAAKLLSRKGFTILRKNYRYLRAEIDIIARKGDILAVVEVKYRRSDHLQPITASIDQKKIGLLIMAADHYVQENDLDVDVRFDIITILGQPTGNKIEHLEKAFSPY